MPTDVEILKTLTSFFYDLAKEVPIGTLNRMLMNTVVIESTGVVARVEYCDDELAAWAKKFAEQLIDYRTKFSKTELHLMGFDRTISKDGTAVIGS